MELLATSSGLVSQSTGMCYRASRPLFSAVLNVVVGFALLLPFAVAAAAPASPVADRATFDKQVTPFLQQHCIKCHGPEKQKGDVRLDNLPPDFVNNPAAGVWAEVRNKLNLGEMPPKDEARPDSAALAAVTRWVAAEQRAVQRLAVSTGGRVLLRRLSRAEYANTVRDLLDVDFVPGEGPEDLLPPDGRLEGFDKVSKALLLDPSLMDQYFRVAEVVASRAVQTRPPLVPSRVARYEFEDTQTYGTLRYIAEGRGTAFNEIGMILLDAAARTFGKLRHPHSDTQIPVRGEYLVRVRAGADPGARGDPVFMEITRGPERIGKARVDAPLDAPQIYEFRVTCDPKVNGEFQVMFLNGTRMDDNNGDSIHFNSHIMRLGREQQFAQAELLKARGRAEGLYAEFQRGRPNVRTFDLTPLPRLLLDYIEVEGPLQGPWPPKSLSTVFAEGREPEKLGPDYARRIFERLLPRAFRRPVTADEVNVIVGLVADQLKRGESFEDAVKAGLVATLCSPSFLYLFEPAGNGPQTTDRRPQTGLKSAVSGLRSLSDYELAARLSYFLWSTLPDEELAAAARAGRLRDASALNAQVQRMLAHPKAEAFVNGFGGQWLKVHEFDSFQPDQQIYPAYYDNDFAGVGELMNREPLEFFREVLRRNESALAFLNADWAMLNEKLAAFYGIAGVKGADFQRVKLPSRAEWLAQLRREAGPQPALGPWHQIGPFEGENFDLAYATEFPPERGVDLAAKYPGRNNTTLAWLKRADMEDGRPWFPFGHSRSAFYLHRVINSPAARELTLSFGVNDSLKVWLNGAPVLTAQLRPRVTPDDQVVRVALRAGENHLLLKVVNNFGSGGFYFRAGIIPASVLAALTTPESAWTPEQTRAVDAYYLDTVPGARRGGLVAMAGFHKWGSDGNRTKPVHRGKYVLEVLFNDPPAPPPPNAGEVQANPRGQNRSIRERLAGHRERESCRNCHAGLDPYGLALENFNAIGQWRTRQDGEKPVEQWFNPPPIEPDGALPNGRSFANFLEYKAALASQSDRFLKGLAEKMFVYALGRTVEPTDAATIDQLVETTKSGGHSLRTLVTAIVRTEAFQTK